MVIKTRAAAREALIEIETKAEQVEEWTTEAQEDEPEKERRRLLEIHNECQTIAASARWARICMEEKEEEGEA